MFRSATVLLLCTPLFAAANPPVASYIFPAGAQRGTKVNVRVGGLFLYQKCGFVDLPKPRQPVPTYVDCWMERRL